MGILGRYLLQRFAVWFTTTLAVLILAILVGEMLLNLGDLLETGSGWGDAIFHLFLLIPVNYMWILVPVAAFIATFVTLGLAARWLELTAIKAGGVSPVRVVVPILVAASVLAALLLLFNDTVVVEASRTLNQLARGDSHEVAFRRGSFWSRSGHVIYNFRDSDSEARVLHHVGVFERDPAGRLRRSIHAEEVHIADDNQWHFYRAKIRGFDPETPEAPASYQVVEEYALHLQDAPQGALLETNFATLSLRNLLAYIQARHREGTDTKRYEAHLHRRLAEPVAVLIFALLAIPLGFRVERTKSLAVPALQGIFVLLVFWSIQHLAVILATAGVTPAAITTWSVVVLFATYGTWQLARAPS